MSEPENHPQPVVTIGGQAVARVDAQQPGPDRAAPGELTVDLEPAALQPTSATNTTAGRNWEPLALTIAVLSLIGLVTVLVLIWRLRARVLRKA